MTKKFIFVEHTTHIVESNNNIRSQSNLLYINLNKSQLARMFVLLAVECSRVIQMNLTVTIVKKWMSKMLFMS